MMPNSNQMSGSRLKAGASREALSHLKALTIHVPLSKTGAQGG